MQWLDRKQEIYTPEVGSPLTLGKLLAECAKIDDLGTEIGVCAIWSQGTFGATGVMHDGEKLVIYVEERRKDP